MNLETAYHATVVAGVVLFVGYHVARSAGLLCRNGHDPLWMGPRRFVCRKCGKIIEVPLLKSKRHRT